MSDKCQTCSNKAVKGTLCMRCHRKFLGAMKDFDVNPYAPKLMQPACTCCEVHKRELEDLKVKVATLIVRLNFVTYDLDKSNK